MVTKIVDDITNRIVHGITMATSKQNGANTFNYMHCMKLFMNPKALKSNQIKGFFLLRKHKDEMEVNQVEFGISLSFRSEIIAVA